jgi:hypothetical protein
MKKLTRFLVVALLAIMLLPVHALAHGHGGCGAGTVTGTRYPVCTVEECDITYSHQHGETWYCGHTWNDGHTHASGLGHGGGHH